MKRIEKLSLVPQMVKAPCQTTRMIWLEIWSYDTIFCRSGNALRLVYARYRSAFMPQIIISKVKQ
ncbi:unnamed protein product [Schistosoma margrebowiei]|uniref:Uncharacterized protein n=1 Tax=Schistosoma margrebowiei TaxID=48269 RepID=A0A3P8B3N6_9TREM|nr:unnamed protein product [Schistosoma margrebowiei]